MSSIFTRTRARPPLAAISSQQVFREVRTEDELRSAVYAENTTNQTSVYGVTGRRIVIAAPIEIKSPIVVTANGITIDSHGKIPVFPATNAIDCIFDLTATANAVINNVLIANNLGVQNPVVGIKLGSFSSLTNCTIIGADTCVWSQFGATIKGNLLSSYGTPETTVYIPSGASSMIVGNFLVGDIVAASGAGNCVISGNCLLGRNINTSLGSGGNAIVGNANVGTITNAATDAVTSNT